MKGGNIMVQKTLKNLKDLSHLIQENKDELYDIDVRGIILDKIQNILSNDANDYICQLPIHNKERKFFESVQKLLNSLIHDLIVNNQNPDIGLKMCSNIGLVLAIYDNQ